MNSYPHVPVAYKFFLGADIGQASDPSCVVLAEKREIPHELPVYIVRYLEPIPLGTSYPGVVERVGQIMRDPQLDGPVRLAVDATGVGRAIVDMLEAAGLNPMSISITGGDTVTHEGIYTRVPKRDLVGLVGVWQRLVFLKAI